MIVWSGIDLILLTGFAVLLAACGALRAVAWIIGKAKRMAAWVRKP